MNLEKEKKNSCIVFFASNPSNRRFELSTLCLQHQRKKEKMINDSKHHLRVQEEKEENDPNDR